MNWNGNGATAYIKAQINAQLALIGVFLTARMKQLAPFRTGFLRNSIFFKHDVANMIVTVYIPPFYAIYVEFGTRWMKAVGFVRQAVLEMCSKWNVKAVDIHIFPRSQIREPLRAYTAGYHLPRVQKLTRREAAHVARHLIPMAEHYAKQFKARGVKFKVKGP